MVLWMNDFTTIIKSDEINKDYNILMIIANNFLRFFYEVITFLYQILFIVDIFSRKNTLNSSQRGYCHKYFF